MEAGSLPVVSVIALRGNQPLNDSGKQEKVKISLITIKQNIYETGRGCPTMTLQI